MALHVAASSRPSMHMAAHSRALSPESRETLHEASQQKDKLAFQMKFLDVKRPWANASGIAGHFGRILGAHRRTNE